MREFVYKKKDRKLRIFNDFLSIIVIALGIYLIIMPLLPEMSYWIKLKTGKISNEIAYSDNNQPGTKPIPQDNRLVIPQMGLDTSINEGKYSDTLKKGVWRRPQTSTPDKGGNTVIVGHRFTYSDGPAIFYHLDKLKVGDQFAVFWQGKKYLYQAQEVRVVEPHQTEIEQNTDEPTLTLYTCTPMWTSKQRLVVIAKPVEDNQSSHE